MIDNRFSDYMDKEIYQLINDVVNVPIDMTNMEVISNMSIQEYVYFYKYKSMPYKLYSEPNNYNLKQLIKFLKKTYSKINMLYYLYFPDGKYTIVLELGNNLLLTLVDIRGKNYQEEIFYKISEDEEIDLDNPIKGIHCSSYDISCNYDTFNEAKKLKSILDNNTVYSISNDLANIGIITMDETGKYDIENIPLDVLVYEDDLETYYDTDFLNEFNKTVDVFNNTTNGIILLHGKPGTGKTFILKKLMSQSFISKYFIYLPIHFANDLTVPHFINLLRTIQSNMFIQKNIVLIIENVESIVHKRTEFGLDIPFLNLLTISDGILNDILNVQLITTINEDEIDISPEFKQKLIASLQLTEKSINETKELYKVLDISDEVEQNMTITDIFKVKNKQKFVEYRKNKINKKMGF